MANLLGIFSMMPELIKEKKIAAKFNFHNEQTLNENNEIDGQKPQLEDDLNEKDLNEFMTNTNKTVLADLSKTGIKYSNFFVIQTG